ncbi:uncharacterized protein [Oscarella lobularis]|uniref:uncharacterized protein n=1 Tax=Oscarella lobularis TaxID=121494 RepID=UPI0033142F06
MENSTLSRYRTWLLILSTAVGLLVALQIGSFWLIFRLYHDKTGSAGISSFSPPEWLSNSESTIIPDNSRERRQTGSDPFSQIFLDALKQICTRNETYCLAGAKGEPGSSGLPGEKGRPGKSGPQGIPGKSGPRGEKGDIGSQGSAGLRGLSGQKGDKGERGFGDKGDKGYAGDIGLPGEKGGKGESGVGIKGDQGFAGEKGDMGLKGEKGEPVSGEQSQVEQPSIASNLPSHCRPANYRILSQNWRKFSVYRVCRRPSRSSTCRCDSTLLQGWYRFSKSIGGKMNEQCSATGWRCGTAASGWLSGSHPTVVGSQELRTVKFGHRRSCNYGTSVQIRVTNCGLFYVYYLTPTLSCDAGYCGAG